MVDGLRDLVDVGKLLGRLERRSEHAAVPADHEQRVVEIVHDLVDELESRLQGGRVVRGRRAVGASGRHAAWQSRDRSMYRRALPSLTCQSLRSSF